MSEEKKGKTVKKKEEWREIEGYSYYDVSSHGRIRSKKRKIMGEDGKPKRRYRGRIMHQRWNKVCKCYFLDLVDDGGTRRTVYPHKETAKAFVTKDDATKVMIIHIDNHPRNNYYENLQWMTRSDHMKWQFKVGNKNNFKVWKTRKKKYKNGFKPETVLPGRPKKIN